MADRTVEESGKPLAGGDQNAPDASSTLAPPPERATPDLGFFERLRHHKVAQWTLAYAAAAYTLLHAVEMISGALGWPHLIVRLTTLVLLLGVPVVITLAWFHGYRGRQRISGAELAVLTVLFAAAGGVLWLLGRPDGAVTASTHAPVERSSTEASIGSGPSIAVLPFENRSQVEEDAFFVVGIHDDILDRLSRLSTVKVISNTSVQQYRDTSLSSRAIAEQLGVRHLLEGGVQRGGSRVRVQLRLIDGVTDANVWSDSYDRELTAENVFAIQTEVASSVAAALDVVLARGGSSLPGTVPTTSIEAWENYQRGRQEIEKRTSDGLERAERFLQRAIDLDPGFALAHAYLGISRILQVEYSGVPLEVARARAEPAVEKALRLGPDLPEAWAASGVVHQFQGDIAEAERLQRRAIALNPNYASAYSWLCNVLRDSGRVDQAVLAAQKYVELDPMSPLARQKLGSTLIYAESYPESESALLESIRLDPLRPSPYAVLADVRAYAQDNLVSGLLLARKAANLDPGNDFYLVKIAAIYLDLGEQERARQLIETALQRGPYNVMAAPGAIRIFMGLGDLPAACAIAERHYPHHPRNGAILRAFRDRDLNEGNPTAARDRYLKAYPEFFASPAPQLTVMNRAAAIDLALVLKKTGEDPRAELLLERAQALAGSRPLGSEESDPNEIADVLILAQRGDNAGALQALRQAERNGWRYNWRYYRDYEPGLASIRDTPEFKAIFADIERDMARQREELRRLPEDAAPKLTLD
jgi:TolB-like protein/tetratricopeptide (TPR) repeat protein